jgi:hypothetical protein
LVLAVVSCSKSFLDVKPKGKGIAQTTNDYDLLLNSNDLLSTSSDPRIPMGDEVAAVEPYISGAFLATQRLFRWDDVIYEPNENNKEIVDLMKQVYTYNKIINEVMDATDGSTAAKESIRAEARAGRAWCYFQLVNFFGKPYTAANAATDPAYPIYTESDVTKNSFARASVKTVYDFIVKDLTDAIPYLPAKPVWRLRMSKAAAEGLLGKVYVFMQQYSDALVQLNAAFNDTAGTAIPLRLYDYNKTFEPGGAFFPVGIFGPSAPMPPNFEEVLYAKNSSNFWTIFYNELVINPETAALYKATDLRLKLFSNTAYAGTAYPLPGLLRKTGTPGMNTPIGVTIPDLLLLRAECKARLNDVAGARSDVELLRANRMPAADVSLPDMTATRLVDYILNEERVREFAVLGYRWHDMRRMSVDPLFRSRAYTHRLYAQDGSIKGSYTLRQERLVLRFSQRILDFNPGMQNNP